MRRPGRPHRLPDVIVTFKGLRVFIEGKVDAGAVTEGAVSEDAQKRVDEGIAHIALAVIYPATLRGIPFENLQDALSDAQFRIRVFNEAGAGEWHQGDIRALDEQLRRSHEQLIQEDIVVRALDILNEGVSAFSAEIETIDTAPQRMIEVLGIGEPSDSTGGNREIAAARIAALVLGNALIFHEELSAYDNRVSPLSGIDTTGMCDSLIEHWQYIIEEINYAPIFLLATGILRSLPARIDGAVHAMARCARNIVALRAALRHDLMGRIYHRLLLEAKFLGTYYTSVPAATILLKLALAEDNWPIQWDEVESISHLRIVDLACGTGTLLMASVQALLDNYVQACVEAGLSPSADELHKSLVENCLWGFDVVASAVHLTASTLAMLAPEVSFDRMNLFCLPLGGPSARMGSIDYLTSQAGASASHPGGYQLPIQADLFGSELVAERVTGSGTEVSLAEVPSIDLCVMNPPFTRSVGGNLLFGSLPEPERNVLQQSLRELLRKPGILAQGTAGLGSVFVAVADRLVADTGRLAFVLPRAMLSGVAWKETRQLLRERYAMEYVIVSHDPNKWNFSENTDLSEVLFIAKRQNVDNADASVSCWVNLWRNPNTAIEAITISDAVSRFVESGAVATLEGQGITQIRENGTVWGEILLVNNETYRDNDIWWPYAFAQSDLTRTFYYLLEGVLKIPGQDSVVHLPLSTLGTIGSLGPDRRDIHDGFERTSGPTSYPAFWGHRSNDVRTLSQEHNSFLSPRVQPLEGRPRRPVQLLWPRAGRLLIAERLRLNTCRLAAVFVNQEVLSNVWWPFSVTEGISGPDDVSRILALWLASTIGLLTLLGHRVETEGAWIELRKPTLLGMPVIDTNALDTEQVANLLSTYDRLAEREFAPFRNMATDPVRGEVDYAFESALGLPPLSLLRECLAREPIISNLPLA